MTTASEAQAWEARVLALILHLERRPFDPWTGDPISLTPAELKRQGQALFQPYPEDGNQWVDRALGALTGRGWLERRGDILWLASNGRQPAQKAWRRWAAPGFDGLLLEADQSVTYARFCRQVYGRALGQFSPVDRTQIQLLTEILAWRRPTRLIDLGCGTGGLTVCLASALGAEIHGVDWGVGALEAARRRAREENEEVVFQRVDLQRLQLPPRSFDALVLVDVMVHLIEPWKLLDRWLPALDLGGCVVILGSDVAEPIDSADPLAWQLRRHGLKIHGVDLTRVEGNLWRRQLEELPGLEGEFRAEGRQDLWTILHQEARRGWRWFKEGRLRRRLVLGVRG